MTNAEAIETLRANYPDACYEQLREAVDAAIEALKAQDVAEDTINRQAVIDALDGYILDETTDLYGNSVREILEQLPSVQPKITCDGCRFVGTYDTDLPCRNCIRREKDCYDPER